MVVDRRIVDILKLVYWFEGAVVPCACSSCEFRMYWSAVEHIAKAIAETSAVFYICNVPIIDSGCVRKLIATIELYDPRDPGSIRL